MTDLNKNNLAFSNSPYLRQHKDNPIHWQEWNSQVLKMAAESGKIIFVSVGYATCHWCHVMASEAFSNQEIADYLNENFVSIKVDREQRPDIDHYLMSYIQAISGQGGWPLNAFLSSKLKPFFATTYLPVESRYNMLPFLQILQKLKQHFETQSDTIPGFKLQTGQQYFSEEASIISNLKQKLRTKQGPQFPQHNSLLLLLSYYAETGDDEIKQPLIEILDSMAKRGLHDHLQGGFYRYCVDTDWTIPHFEKMLYDQALHLWVYSTAYKVLQKEEYRKIAEKIVICLQDTFQTGDLFFSAHDADTRHSEGFTYLWDQKELQEVLTSEEYRQFQQVYELKTNFENKIHLIKKKNFFLPQIEKKLLQIRVCREQPFTDRKLLTNWNALLGIALINASRYLQRNDLKEKALKLYQELIRKHYINDTLYHSSFEAKLQKDEFLEDYALLLLFVSYLHEESADYKPIMNRIRTKVLAFKKYDWMSNRTEDFQTVPADSFDQPTPSSVSLAEMALLRVSILLNENYTPARYKQASAFDFHNLMAFISLGNWHIIQSPEIIHWENLPMNTIQVHSDRIQRCYKGACNQYRSLDDMLKILKTYYRK